MGVPGRGDPLDYDDQGIGFVFFVLTYTGFIPGWLAEALFGPEPLNIVAYHFALLVILQLAWSLLIATVCASRNSAGESSILAKEIRIKRKR